MRRKLKKITEAHITHISFVPKGANGQDFLIVKTARKAPDLVCESPILKLDEEKRLVTGVVYVPDTVDSQGEFMEADAVEKAAHEFMISSAQMDERHSFMANKKVRVVESCVTKSDSEIDGRAIRKGTWIITARVEDDRLWNAVKNGEYRGFSMGGTGTREEVEEEEYEVTREELREELRAALAEVMEPMTDRLQQLTETVETMMTQRLERLEKSRGVSRLAYDEPVEKQNSREFGSVEI